MYSEIIYTRCGEGVDMIKGFIPIHPGPTGGFFVYALSDSIKENKTIDLPLLHNFVISKQSYADPGFMADAYLYLVPDKGDRFLMDFFPIHFDKDAKGNYPHRRDNFINQVFAGGFQEFYPFETFGNADVWNAKGRGEAYYYENPSEPLPERESLDDTIGYISQDELQAFIHDGRRDLLKKAVAFIISQYGLLPEERKYLVIKDENDKNIELWIAAIESAFSPRMSSGLPFATRLDRFTSVNRYTVNLNGQYQKQINLQDPSQKLRYRAMIVGVDERDRSNSSAARVTGNSNFVLLDGKAGTFSCEVDITDPYFDAVTEFDEKQLRFCREFLQMLDIIEPSPDVKKLYRAYTFLNGQEQGDNAKKAAAGVSLIEEYRLIKNSYLGSMYQMLKGRLSGYLTEDTLSAFSVLSWLSKTAPLVGDEKADESFTATVSESFSDYVFNNPRDAGAGQFWHDLRGGRFSIPAASLFTSESTIGKYSSAIGHYKAEDWQAFMKIYADCLNMSENASGDLEKAVMNRCLKVFYESKDKDGAVLLLSDYKLKRQNCTPAIVLDQIEHTNDNRFAGFLMQLLVRVFPETVSSGQNLLNLYRQLERFGKRRLFEVPLTIRADSCNRPENIESYLNWLMSVQELQDLDLAEVYAALDSKLKISDSSGVKAALKIQANKPPKVSCINSAHIYALAVSGEKRIPLVDTYKQLSKQGFPSIEDSKYAQALTARLLDSKLPGSELAYVAALFSRSPFYIRILVDEILKSASGKQGQSSWNVLIEAANKIDSDVLFGALVDGCSELKNFEKTAPQLEAALKSSQAKKYFATVRIDAEQRIEARSELSKFSFRKLFSKGKQ